MADPQLDLLIMNTYMYAIMFIYCPAPLCCQDSEAVQSLPEHSHHSGGYPLLH